MALLSRKENVHGPHGVLCEAAPTLPHRSPSALSKVGAGSEATRRDARSLHGDTVGGTLACGGGHMGSSVIWA